MTCREFWRCMPELEAGGQTLEHARECPRCAALLERQDAMARGLRRAASQRNDLQAPARLEEQLREVFRRNVGAPLDSPPTHQDWPRWPKQVSVAAAAVVLGIVLLWRHSPQPVQPIGGGESIASAELDADFTPLPYAGESGPVDDANLIRVEMPRSALIALGVPVTDGEASEAVEAEVVLGMSGAPQAVRVLQ